MQKEFINVAAHGLRTPIHEVLLSKEGNIEEYKEFLNVISRNAKRLQGLTEDTWCYKDWEPVTEIKLFVVQKSHAIF